MNRLLTVIVALVIICGASSCKLWRRVTAKPRAVDTAIVLILDSARTRPDTALVRADTVITLPPALPDSAKLALLQAWSPLWHARADWSTFSGRSDLSYSGGGESHDLNASIRMERDRRIWVSVTALLGIEVARALITPDTIVLINRLQNEVQAISFAEAGKLLPVATDFYTLQSLIIGDLLPSGLALTDVGEIGESFTLHALTDSMSHEAGFSKADTSLQLQVLTSGKSSLRGIYYGYAMADRRRFSMSRELSMNDGGATHQINIKFSKATFDEPVDMSFSIPAKYKRK